MSLLGALSAIREVAISKFFDFLLDKLVSFEFLQFVSEQHIQEELEKLKKELLEIRALLDDAEERQLKDQSVEFWLSDLLNLAYDVDDIVDELETETSRRNLMLECRGSSSKKPKLISDSFNVVMFNRGMASKIKDISAKLKNLEPQKNQLQLRMIDCSKSNRMKERQQPTSLQIETHVYGRDKDKEAILELVFKSDDEGNFVIPIVGMGGIDKTTLAQLVYNDATIQNHFDIKAWVCVSDDFDVTRITKAIFQSVTSEPCNDDDLNSLQEKLKKKLSEKKFLIVLDDVWNENYHNWTILQSPFLTRTPGSKIIVTTRSFAVSSTVGASLAHSLQVLSEDDCLSVFAQHALGAIDFGGHPNLKEVAEKIVRKCDGLPLAAKTLGGLPRDEFQERENNLLWKAEGFLQEARDKHSIEALGHKYFGDLVSRSLLQISNKDRSRFVMHDLISDLAQSVAGEKCFRIEGDRQISKHTRHLSYIGGKYDGIKKFKGISEAQHLRTFLPFRLSNDKIGYVTYNVLSQLLPNLRCLRVLSLGGYQIVKLPIFIGDLKHLRYLDFSYTLIKSLPESISTLYNLETLLLRECQKLEKLPSEMENLVNLCFLDITGAYRLEGIFSNFGTIADLQTLSNFALYEGNGSQIRELEDLSNLKGQLCISGLENLVETQDAWKVKLDDKPGLDKLELKWSRCFENSRKEIEKKVLDLLQPPKKLKELVLGYYCGVRLAEWIANSSINNLLSLYLENCPNCTSLPSIGQLPLLEKLPVKGLHNVTSVGVEFFGEKTPDAFRSLDSLEFEDMPKWENWNFCEVDEEARKFPRLRLLLIQNCPKLLGSIPENLPCLEKLVIFNCEKLVISIQSLPMLSELKIHRCHQVVYKGFADDRSLRSVYFSKIPKFTCAADWLMLGSTKVESLEIDDCEELCSLRENNWGLLTQSMSLVYLTIRNWPQLVSIGAEEEKEELMQLKIPGSIEQMRIENCERLEKLSTRLHYITSLRVLELLSCPKLISLSKSNLPLHLKRLVINKCENLQRLLLDEGENVNSISACLLEQLDVRNCPCLVSLSSRGELPTRLKQLRIWCCAKLESIAQEIQDSSSLEYIQIVECCNIKYLPQGLNKLSHLRNIHVSDCSNLVSFPKSGLITPNLKVLSLGFCQKLQSLPDGMHNLNCLEELKITNCSSLTCFPEEGIPTNLRELVIEGPNICKPLIKWGLHRLASLEILSIQNGCPDAESFPQEEIGMMLPCSLTRLDIFNLPKLQILSSKGFQYLPCLEYLSIGHCPNLKSLPEKNMLSSLLRLDIWNCPLLNERFEKKGPEWSKIAHIPCVQIDDRYIYDSS
ncbi:putative disease resistance RPP13-like protein 1 [Durio zibethinus]|uniref:Disease resistance RPP13-like protein 1 n=1 Tax=Durio zibethinus TaxID=66656 RepID=A0A6P5Z6B1_DURZI|nr:putative disease resistance RPP13-like protein 1 [Durio zibethinus]